MWVSDAYHQGRKQLTYSLRLIAFKFESYSTVLLSKSACCYLVKYIIKCENPFYYSFNKIDIFEIKNDYFHVLQILSIQMSNKESLNPTKQKIRALIKMF